VFLKKKRFRVVKGPRVNRAEMPPQLSCILKMKIFLSEEN
jgi:hypothetical protein